MLQVIEAACIEYGAGSVQRSVSVRPYVRASVCPFGRHLPLAAAWARQQISIDSCSAVYRLSISAAGAGAAAVGSVMLRAEVRGSMHACTHCLDAAFPYTQGDSDVILFHIYARCFLPPS